MGWPWGLLEIYPPFRPVKKGEVDRSVLPLFVLRNPARCFMGSPPPWGPFHLAPYDFTSIDMDELPTDITAILAGQKHIGRGHLTGLSRPSHGGLLSKFGNILKTCGDQRGPDGPGGNPIDPNFAFGQHLGQRTGKTDYGPFGTRVVHQLFIAPIGGHRAGVDYRIVFT